MADREQFHEVFCGIDVGKENHHAYALDGAGRRVHDKILANDESALRVVFTKLTTHGRVLVVIDQPASIGALSITVARDMGIDIAYLPGLTMRRLADLHPGQAKTDARDDDTLAELGVLAGYDDDLAQQTTRLTNRLRDALLHVHPALERLLGKHIDRGGVIDLLAVTGTPHAIANLGQDGIAALMRPRSPRLATTLPAKILAALAEQSVVVTGTDAFGRVITGVAAQLSDVRAERDRLGIELEERLDAHPLAEVLTSMPGVGFRTAIKILTIIGDSSAFATAAHLASHAGLAPVTRRSGSSVRGESHSRRGNHALKNALFLSAFAALTDPDSRAYYDRKRAEGRRHNAAVICLARRRVDVLFAMLRDHTTYRPGAAAIAGKLAIAA